MKGNEMKKYSDNTLYSLSKKELIEYIIWLEHNLENERQYQMLMDKVVEINNQQDNETIRLLQEMSLKLTDIETGEQE